MSKLLLIDGYSILFRAFYGMNPGMTAPDGLHTNAVYGFLSIMSRIMEEEKPDYLAVAFDLPEPTFRHKMYEAYKGNRSAAPEEFHEQVPVIRQVLTDMTIPTLTCAGYEADDILGTLASRAGEQGIDTVILSGDRDLLQIASDKTVVVIPKTKAGQTVYERYTPADVKEAFGVTPAGFIELKAMMGDTSDNIPGLPGVGPKTAQKIMESYGSIENAHAHTEELKPKKAMEAFRDHYEDLQLSLKLVTICTDVPVSFDPESFRLGDIYNEKVYEDYRRLGFRSLLKHFEKKETAPQQETIESRIITDFAEYDEFMRKAAAQPETAVSLYEEKGEMLAAAVAIPKETVVLLPEGFLTGEVIRSGLKTLLEGGKPVAVMQAKDILKAVPAAENGQLFDCILASYLLDPLKSDWSYDAVSVSCLQRNVASAEEIFGKKGPAYIREKEPEHFQEKIVLYLTVQAETALRSAGILKKRLQEQEMDRLMNEIEMPLTYVLASMEQEGILVSREELKRYGDSLASGIEELTARIYEAAGEEFNINSPKQLGVILFEKMQLPGGKKTKTGFSTAADVLEKLAPEQPIVADILRYRTLSKLKSTYADGLTEYIDPDSRIRTTFNQTITATGRLSSTEPNLQNIPMREELGRLIRKCFYPAEGNVFVDADYSQIELRILAHMSGDEQLIDAYRQAKDIHRITASQVFHIPFDEVTDAERRNAKAVNFGIVYGISSFGLSQGLSITRKEAQAYIEQYFAAYPKIKSFLDGLIASAKETGYAVSIFGRRRPVPELRSQNFMQRSFGERVAMNSPIQGSAADIMKIAMNRVYRRLKAEVPEAKLILQIHDELLIETPEALAEQVKTILTEEMAAAASLSVSLETDCHIGTDWYQAK
ncbi:MAG: DNA polymerase I [Lachnospiraceae bacterium]|nr:DNA polymerase I [Lachnospiraceae bacterium]